MTEASTADAPATTTGRWWTGLVLEAVVASATVAMFLASCVLIRVYPLDRIGQVSGLASLGLRFTLFSSVLIAALVISARVRSGRGFDLTSRLVCAGIAGLATAMIGGGIMVALRGTPWGLNGKGGDAGALAAWASALHRGEAIPPTYPPLALHFLHRYADLVGLAPELAMKHLQILGTAAFGPIAYLSWRLLLRPMWALAIGVIAMLPLIEPYKPFPNLVLVVFVPLAILFLTRLRNIAEANGLQVVRAGVGFGLAFGVLCLTYSGWFQWSAPGLFFATLIVFPWRQSRRAGLVLLAITGAVFVLITAKYLGGLLFDPAGKIADKYIYFDVKTDPMYVAMWRNDTPGIVGVWPPLGELGGVGLFTIVLAIGFGSAVALGRKTTLLIATVAMTIGAFAMRFFFARQMSTTKLVQLYPRTTPLILYCLLILTGLAVYWWVQRAKPDSPLRGRAAMIGAACGLLLLFGSAGSATSDRYMPSNTTPPGAGWLAWNSHQTKWGARPKVLRSHSLPWVRRSLLPAASGAPAPAVPARDPGPGPAPDGDSPPRRDPDPAAD